MMRIKKTIIKCRDKLAQEHPTKVGKYYIGGCSGCPSNYGYLKNPDYCDQWSKSKCFECWNREITEIKINYEDFLSGVAQKLKPKLEIISHNFLNSIKEISEDIENSVNARASLCGRCKRKYYCRSIQYNIKNCSHFLQEEDSN